LSSFTEDARILRWPAPASSISGADISGQVAPDARDHDGRSKPAVLEGAGCAPLQHAAPPTSQKRKRWDVGLAAIMMQV
jgi:hypothetical protein